jgi:hypothetical protein
LDEKFIPIESIAAMKNAYTQLGTPLPSQRQLGNKLGKNWLQNLRKGQT